MSVAPLVWGFEVHLSDAEALVSFQPQRLVRLDRLYLEAPPSGVMLSFAIGEREARGPDGEPLRLPASWFSQLPGADLSGIFEHAMTLGQTARVRFGPLPLSGSVLRARITGVLHGFQHR